MRDRFNSFKVYWRGSGLGPFLIRATAGSGAIQFSGIVAGILVGIQLARGLGVHAYGQYGIAMAVITMAGIPSEFGVPRVVTREVATAATRADIPRLFGVIRWANRSVTRHSVLVALVGAIGAYVAGSWSSESVAPAIVIGLLSIPLIALAKVRGAALQGLHSVVLSQMPVDLLRPLLMSLLLLCLFSLNPQAGAAEAMALNVLTAGAALVLAHHLLRARLPVPSPSAPVTDSRAWFRSAIPVGLTDGMRLMRTQIAVLVMGVLVSASEVGLFRTAYAVVTVISLPATLVAGATLPVFARLFAKQDSERLRRVATISARVQFGGMLLMSLPILFSAEQIIRFAFGSEYESAAPALRILCLGILTSAVFGLGASVLTMTGHERRVTRAMLISLSVGLVGLVVLVPRGGSAGAATATALSMIIWNGLTWAHARRALGVDTSLVGLRNKEQ